MDKILISNFIKAKRKELNISINEAIDRLHSHGILISSKTLYGWESGHRQPDADAFIALCEIYGVKSFSEIDNRYLQADPDLNPLERTHIQKYRRLTDNGRATVDNVIDGLLEAGQPAREQEQKEPEKIIIPIAARNGTGKQLELTPDELQRLKQVIEDSQDQDLSGIV